MKESTSATGQTRTHTLLFEENVYSQVLGPDLAQSSGAVPGYLESAWQHKSYSEGNTQGIVMVIDDEISIVNLMETFFELYEITVKGFTNPCDAIDWYEEHWRQVELVFLDMCSPIMNGEDCFPVLRSINPTVQIVLISGRVDFVIVNELMAQGALCFVHKPFHFPSMAGWVLHRLGRSVPDKVLREDAFS